MDFGSSTSGGVTNWNVEWDARLGLGQAKQADPYEEMNLGTLCICSTNKIIKYSDKRTEVQFMKKLNDVVLDILQESIKAKKDFIENNVDLIIKASERIAQSIASGHKILLFGNGGSAADAQHIAAEFVNRFMIERPPIAAMALTTDSSVLTSIANDYSFDELFSKQILALGKQDDIAIGINTSGTSKNVVKAMKTAKELGLFTIGITGAKGALADCSDILFSVSSGVTARIQETHNILGHLLCDLVDRILYADKYKDK